MPARKAPESVATTFSGSNSAANGEKSTALVDQPQGVKREVRPERPDDYGQVKPDEERHQWRASTVVSVSTPSAKSASPRAVTPATKAREPRSPIHDAYEAA